MSSINSRIRVLESWMMIVVSTDSHPFDVALSWNERSLSFQAVLSLWTNCRYGIANLHPQVSRLTPEPSGLCPGHKCSFTQFSLMTANESRIQDHLCESVFSATHDGIWWKGTRYPWNFVFFVDWIKYVWICLVCLLLNKCEIFQFISRILFLFRFEGLVNV